MSTQNADNKAKREKAGFLSQIFSLDTAAAAASPLTHGGQLVEGITSSLLLVEFVISASTRQAFKSSHFFNG